MDGFYDKNNNSVAVCGSNFTNVQLKLLLKNCDINEIVIAFDKEYSRLDSTKAQKYFNKLYKICTNYNKYCNFSFISVVSFILFVLLTCSVPLRSGHNHLNSFLSSNL